jgi:hypothetical protein
MDPIYERQLGLGDSPLRNMGILFNFGYAPPIESKDYPYGFGRKK